MTGCGRRLVLDANFETTVGLVCAAIRDEGLQTLTRTDVREHFWRHLSHGVQHCEIVDAWSPDLAFEAIHLDLEAVATFPTRFVIYEQPDGKAVVTATEPMAPLADEPGWRASAPALARIADQERERIAHVFDRLTSHKSARAAAHPVA
jgi:uncharacterized protein (DUF302 family)